MGVGEVSFALRNAARPTFPNPAKPGVVNFDPARVRPLVLRGQQTSREPGHRLQLGALEQRIGRGRGLLAVCAVLPQVPVLEAEWFRVPAGGTFESLRPLQHRRQYGTLPLGP